MSTWKIWRGTMNAVTADRDSTGPHLSPRYSHNRLKSGRTRASRLEAPTDGLNALARAQRRLWDSIATQSPDKWAKPMQEAAVSWEEYRRHSSGAGPVPATPRRSSSSS